MPDKKLFIQLGTEGKYWDTETWEQGGSKYMEENPSAQIWEVAAYDPADESELDTVFIDGVESSKYVAQMNKPEEYDWKTDAATEKVRYRPVNYWKNEAESIAKQMKGMDQKSDEYASLKARYDRNPYVMDEGYWTEGVNARGRMYDIEDELADMSEDDPRRAELQKEYATLEQSFAGNKFASQINDAYTQHRAKWSALKAEVGGIDARVGQIDAELSRIDPSVPEYNATYSRLMSERQELLAKKEKNEYYVATQREQAAWDEADKAYRRIAEIDDEIAKLGKVKMDDPKYMALKKERDELQAVFDANKYAAQYTEAMKKYTPQGAAEIKGKMDAAQARMTELRSERDQKLREIPYWHPDAEKKKKEITEHYQSLIADAHREYREFGEQYVNHEWVKANREYIKNYLPNLRAQIEAWREQDVDVRTARAAAVGAAREHGVGDGWDTIFGMMRGEDPAVAMEANAAVEMYDRALLYLNAAERMRNAHETYGQGIGHVGMEKLEEWGSQSDFETAMEIWAIYRRLQEQIGDLNEINEDVLETFLTKPEQALILSFMEYNQAQAEIQEDASWWYKAGVQSGEMIPFMLEFMVTGDLGSKVDDVVKTAVKTKLDDLFIKWFGKVTKKTVGSAFRNFGSNAISGALGTLARAAVQTAVRPTAYTHIAESLTTIKKDGTLADSAGEVMEAVFDEGIETLSELMGSKLFGLAPFGRLVKDLFKASPKVVANITGSKFYQFGKAALNSKLAQGVGAVYNWGQKGFKAVGFDGFVEEILEEVWGAAAREAVGLDEEALDELFKEDNFMPMVISMACLPGLQVAGGAVNYAQANVRKLYLQSSVEKDLSGIMKDEQIAHIFNRIDAAETPQEMSETLEAILIGVSNAGGSRSTAEKIVKLGVVQAKFKTLTYAQAFDEKQVASEKQQEIEKDYGEFWMKEDAVESAPAEATGEQEEGEQKTEPKPAKRQVQLAQLNDGSMVFILDAPNDHGEVPVIDVDTKRKGAANMADIAVDKKTGNPLSRTWSIDDFITMQVTKDRSAKEKARMAEEKKQNIAKVQQSLKADDKINLGTETAPNYVVVESFDENGVKVIDAEGNEISLTWEQVGNARGIRVKPLTDVEKVEQEVKEFARREAERIKRRHGTTEAAEFDGEMADAIEKEETYIPTNPDGSVDEVAFWNNDPEGWARWNDKQNEDGGADTLQQIEAAKAELMSMLGEARKGMKTSDPNMRKMSKAKALELEQKIARLEALELQYSPEAQAEKRLQEWEKATGVKFTRLYTLADVAAVDARAVEQARAGGLRAFAVDSKPYIYMQGLSQGEAKGAAEADEIFMHEAVSHIGLKGLLGTRAFNELCQMVWERMSPEARRVYSAYAGTKGNHLAAADEYIAHVAEKMGAGIADMTEKTIWEKIVEWVRNVLRSMGFNLTMSETELSDLLRMAYANLKQSQQNVQQEITQRKNEVSQFPAEVKEALAEMASLSLEEQAQTTMNDLNAAQEAYDKLMKAAPKVKAGETTKDYIARKKAHNEKVAAAEKELAKALTIANEVARLVSQQKALETPEAKEMSVEELAAPRSLEPSIIGGEADPIGETDGNGSIRFSTLSYEQGGRDYLVNWLAKEKYMEQDEKDFIVATLDQQYAVAKELGKEFPVFGAWSSAEVNLDEDGNPVMSVIKNNGDYAMNLDFSLICKKRRPLNALLDVMIADRMLDMRQLDEQEIATINKVIQRHGFEVACALCFVDSKRYRTVKVAKTFADMYNEIVESLIPAGSDIVAYESNYAGYEYINERNAQKTGRDLSTVPASELNWEKVDEILKGVKRPKSVEQKIAWALRKNASQRRLVNATDFVTNLGFESVKKNNPELLKIYNSKKGTGGPKASFGDVQYLNDILKSGKFTADKAAKVGGVRIQSFSDYMGHMFFDYMQMVAELSAKGLTAHAYTKEEAFARIFGMTGIKINMSLVPAVAKDGVAAGLDAEGNYVWAVPYTDEQGNEIQGQTFPPEVAFELQKDPRYSGNLGVIAVGVSDAHILKMLNDENIHFIIPYHKSSLNPIVAKMTGIDQYEDYTDVQNERLVDKPQYANLESTQKGNIIKKRKFDFYGSLARTNDPKATAKEYLEHCRKNDLVPKYEAFSKHENYYKLLADFNLYDFVTGEYAPQAPVKMNFPEELNDLVRASVAHNEQLESDLKDKVGKMAEDVKAELGDLRMSTRITPEQGDLRFSIANESQAIFVSNAAKAVEGIKMDKATPEQWLNMLTKNGGLKAAEDKWLGLSDWLKASDKKSLTKDEVLQFINENKIQIEEVHYSEDGMTDDEMFETYIQSQEGMEHVNYQFSVDAADYAREQLEGQDLYDDEYEEELSRLESEYYEDDLYGTNYDMAVAKVREQWEEDGKKGVGEGERMINETRLDYTTEGLENKHEIALTIPTIEPYEGSLPDVHFFDAGEGRAVAWIRFGETSMYDRKDNVYKDVLVIDEIQSQRHQDAREKGYTAKKEAEEYSARMNEKYGTTHYGWQTKATPEEYAEYGALVATLTKGVPSAPFEKNWHELAMKRMLRYAAENGYDAIAWTKGEQQAGRYNIGGVVKDIYYVGMFPISRDSEEKVRYVDINLKYRHSYHLGVAEDGLIKLEYDEDGEELKDEERSFKDKLLADVVGKEAASQIMQMDEQTSLTPEGLKVGGEGMKGFYDKMLPSFMNKYGKKWGVKVSDMEFPNLEDGLTMHSIPVTEEMKESVMQGQLMFSVIMSPADNKYTQEYLPNYLFESDIRFSISKNNKQTITNWLNKRNDLSEKVKEGVMEIIEQYNDATTQLCIGKWFSQGTISLPEDLDNCLQAVASAKKAKVNALSYANPMEIINEFGIIKSKKKPVDPDAVSTLKRAKAYDNGIVIYDVEESEESRKNLREIINTHYGVNASPWCLLQGDENGNLTKQSATFWENYSAVPKRVVFKNGKLLAFFATSSKLDKVWWDRLDRPWRGVPVSTRDANDPLKREVVRLVNERTGRLGRKPAAIQKETRKDNGDKTVTVWRSMDANDVVSHTVVTTNGETVEGFAYGTDARLGGPVERFTAEMINNLFRRLAWVRLGEETIEASLAGVRLYVNGSVEIDFNDTIGVVEYEIFEDKEDGKVYKRPNRVYNFSKSGKLLDVGTRESGEWQDIKDKETLKKYEEEARPWFEKADDLRRNTQKRMEEIKSRIAIEGVTGDLRFSVVPHESSMDEVDGMFKQYNGDPFVSDLYGKVSELAHTMGLKISFAEGMGRNAGLNALDKIKYNVDYFNSPDVYAQDKAKTLLHELIHSVTRYAIYAKDAEFMSSRLKEAVAQLESIYEEIKDDPAFEGMYGITSVEEMVSELANVRFRAKLREKNLLQKVVDAIKDLLGIDKGGKALDNLSATLEDMIFNFDRAAYEQVRSDVSKQDNYIRFSVKPEVRAEMDGILANAMVDGLFERDENGVHMLAPNGKRSNLDMDTWAMVRTKNFKNWFGDWMNDPENASKVVDENGEPRVVYHQTNASVYINRETGQNWDELGWKEKMEWDERDDWDEYWEEQEFNTFSRVNARTTNEFDGFFFAPEYDEYHEYGERTIPAFLNIKNPASREDYNIDSSKNDAGKDERIRLQNEGFDGVIRMEGDEVWEYVAFEPSQIKSIHNNGEFSESGDIRFSVSELEGMTVEQIVNSGKQKMLEAAAEAKDSFMERVFKINARLDKVRAALAAQREYDQTTAALIADMANEMLENGALSKVTRAEIKRIVSAVKNAVGKQDITPYVDRIMDVMIGNQIRNAKNRLNEFLKIKGKKVNSSGVEVQGKLDIEGQGVLAAMKKGMAYDMAKLESEIAEAEDRLFDSSQVISRDAANELAGLYMAQEYMENIKASEAEEVSLRDELDKAQKERRAGRMSREAYREYEKSIVDAVRENRMQRVTAYENLLDNMAERVMSSIAKANALREADKARVERIRHFANSDMEGMPADELKQTPKAQWFWNSTPVRFFLSPLATFDQMLRHFAPKSRDGKGYLWNHFMGGWMKAAENEYTGVRDAHSVLDEKARQVFGKDVKRWSDIFSIVKRLPNMKFEVFDAGKMKEYEFTQGNLMYIYMVNKMSDGKMKLRRMGITEEQVEQIAREMDPRLVELADWLQDSFLPSLREKYNTVHERMFGAPMAAIENYFPLVINQNARAREEDVNNPQGAAKPSTITGAIVKRTKNSAALDLLNADALDVVLGHIEEMEHWAAFAEWNRDLNTLLSYKTFRNRLQNSSGIYGAGSEVWKNFRTTAEIAAGVYQPAGKKAHDKLTLNMAKGVTGAKIAFRVYTALKQFFSAPAFISDSRPDILMKNMANPMGAWNWAMENLPLFEKRWKSRQAGDSRLMATESDWKVWKTKAVEIAGRIGMTPNAFVDAVTVSIGARSIYETKYRQYLDYGYSEEQADAKAKQDATVLFNESQQSNEAAFLSQMQVDRTVASTLFTVFRNSSMGYQRMYVDALRNLGRMMKKGYKEESIEYMKKQMIRDGLTEEQAQRAAEKIYRRSFTKNATQAFTFGFLVQFAWNLGPVAVYLLLGDDDDDKKDMLMDAAVRAAVGGPVEGLTAGPLVSGLLGNAAMGEKLSEVGGIQLPAVSDLEALKTLWDTERYRGLNDLFNIVVQSGIGVNPQTFTDVITAVVDACNGDLETSKEVMFAVLRILQVPQSQIDKLYLEEMDITADEAYDMTVQEFAERYAKYKMMRNAPLTKGLYPEEDAKAREEKYIKRFLQDMRERRKTHGSEEAQLWLEYIDTEFKEMGETLRDLKKTVLKAEEGSAEQKAAEDALEAAYESPEYEKYGQAKAVKSLYGYRKEEPEDPYADAELKAAWNELMDMFNAPELKRQQE